jgi:hypothetical protein
VKHLNIRLWINAAAEPVRHGYTPANEDDAHTLRIGPFVAAWELIEE